MFNSDSDNAIECLPDTYTVTDNEGDYSRLD